ncbi:kinase domain protein [Thalictrum thalictroides]|uniref:Kinase domain protein n=1 Tax=Thalictrum thalictroides TaxID=46969 RepID=A0A7J6V724_THATH|nr:kinase domain protein [Thalictrum thalictroides]
MKLNIISILFIAVHLVGVFAASDISNSAAEYCGSLGVTSTEDLPASINAADVRICADHPLGHKRSGVQSLAPMSNADLTAAAANNANNFLAFRGIHLDACFFEAPFGCSNGFCWRVCGPAGSGQWCWIASNGGAGDWTKCSSYLDCRDKNAPSFDCGRNCKQGSKACGCSCDH